MRYALDRPPVLTLTSGPVDAYPEVLLGLAKPVLYDFDPAFQRHYEAIVKKAQRALRSAAPPVVLHGEPVLGLEAAAASLIARGDTVLNLASGVYGKGFGYWAARHTDRIEEIEVPYNEAIDPRAVAERLQRCPLGTIVSVVHHDTPSGTLNPIEEIGQIVREHGSYLLVDAVSSFGGMNTDPESCRSDIYVTGANKCLGAPPALTLMAVSDRGWAKMKNNPDAPRASMLSILDWEEASRHDKHFPFTPSVAEMNGLDAALELYLNEGPERVWVRHALTARATREGIKAMGVSLWASPEEIASPTTTAVACPAGIDEERLRAEARGRYGVTFSSGRGETLGKLTRIGHMGPTAQPLHAISAVAAYGGALRALGHPCDPAAGVAAALAVIDAAD